MIRPFPMTRVAGAVFYQMFRLYFALPWWGKLIDGIVAFVWIAKG